MAGKWGSWHSRHTSPRKLEQPPREGRGWGRWGIMLSVLKQEGRAPPASEHDAGAL